MKKFYFLMIGNQMRAFGKTLQGLDPDSKGSDDVAGLVLDLGGQAFIAGASDENSFKARLRQVADAIYDYLGLTPPTR
jgi:hypothetical protein